MKYLFYLIFPLLIFAQDPSFHEPWKLEGAGERIEKYRKTNTILNFNFPTDIKKKNGKLKIKLITEINIVIKNATTSANNLKGYPPVEELMDIVTKIIVTNKNN